MKSVVLFIVLIAHSFLPKAQVANFETLLKLYQVDRDSIHEYLDKSYIEVKLESPVSRRFISTKDSSVITVGRIMDKKQEDTIKIIYLRVTKEVAKLMKKQIQESGLRRVYSNCPTPNYQYFTDHNNIVVTVTKKYRAQEYSIMISTFDYFPTIEY